MNPSKVRFLFLNLGHAYDHMFMLLFPTVLLTLEHEWNLPFNQLLLLLLGGKIAFGAGALPSGWLGDRWNRKHLLTVFFIGIGFASIATGFSSGPIGMAVGLTAIGIFASIYHPVGVALVVQGVPDVGRRLGINGVAGNLGVAAAAVTAGALIDFVHWRAAFIVPGAVSILTGLAFALLTPPAPVVRRATEQNTTEGNAAPAKGGAPAAGKNRTRGVLPGMILLILGMTFLGGLIFNSILDSLPKIFALRLLGLPTSGLGISGLVSGVYVVGAMGQIVVGMLLDRYSLRRIYIAVVLLQVPFLLIASRSSEWALVGVSCVMMFTIFGVIPIQDTLVARSTSDEWRARAYALKYVVALGVGFLAVPLVSYVYQSTGEFVWLFGLFAGISLSMVGLAFLLPAGIAPPPRALASSLASSPAAGGAAGGGN